jgi:integrase
MQGSVYSTRIQACRQDCGKPEAKTCPARRAGHTRWGFVCNLRQLDKGKWQQLRRQGFATKAEAEKALVNEIGDIDAGKALPLASRQITVAEYAKTWLADQAHLRPSSTRSYRLMVAMYISPRKGLGSIRLIELNAAQIRAWRERIRTGELRPAASRRRPDGLLSARTINHIAGVLRTMLAQAAEDGLITANPCQSVKPLASEGHKFEVWSPQQADAFLAFAEAHGPAWAAIGYRLAVKLGLRRGEIVALTWDNITADRLTVRANAVAVGREVVIGAPKCKKGARVIPLRLDPGMRDALDAHRKRQPVQRISGGLVVADERGEQVPPWLLSETFGKLAKAAGLPVIRLHDCRHTAATIMYEATKDIKATQAWLGHATASITEGLYIHDRGEALDAAAEQVGAYWERQSMTSN